MAIKTRTQAPWWVSLIFVVGLILTFVAQRALADFGGAKSFALIPGLLLLVGATILRLKAFLSGSQGRRRVEWVLLLCHLGVLLALALYWLTTNSGNELLGISGPDENGLERFNTPTTVLWVLVLICSLLPLFMVEFTLGTGLRSRFAKAGEEEDDGLVETVRVAQTALSGLSIALAGCFLMVTCNVASERNIRKDYSYFKTSSPGASTTSIVKNISDPVEVLLFFPQPNEVGEEVNGYFQELARQTNKLQIRRLDRVRDKKEATEYKVSKDGTIVLVRGKKNQKFTIDADLKKSQRKLRELDQTVNKELMKVVRKRRTIYMTSGHGEVNQSGAFVLGGRPGTKNHVSFLKKELRNQNLHTKDLGNMDLAVEVPEDATAVLILGAMKPFSEDELRSLDDYLKKGGAVLVALDPSSDVTFDGFLNLAKVNYNRAPIADLKYRRREHPSFILTDQISTHASVSKAAKVTGSGFLFLGTGSFDEAGEVVAPWKRTTVVNSMKSSWRETGKDFRFDEKMEKKDRYGLVVALESAKTEGSELLYNGSRLMLFGDREIFTDVSLQSISVDAVKWIIGEEVFSGEVVSEKDVKIEHSRKQDVLWFWLCIAGMPLAILIFGLTYTNLRGRKGSKNS